MLFQSTLRSFPKHTTVVSQGGSRNAFRTLISKSRSLEKYEKQSHVRLGIPVLDMYRFILLKKQKELGKWRGIRTS